MDTGNAVLEGTLIWGWKFQVIWRGCGGSRLLCNLLFFDTGRHKQVPPGVKLQFRLTLDHERSAMTVLASAH